MRNHIAVKFIAVLLCAAALLGAVGSALAIFALNEADLYNKTVDQIYEERVQSYGNSFANTLAVRYAGSNLGGVPEALLEQHYGSHWYSDVFDYANFGYSLLDSQGNVLTSDGNLSAQNAKTYTFPISGQYMHIVSITPPNEASQPAELPQEPIVVSTEDMHIYDAIPAEGTKVYGFSFVYSDGSSASTFSEDGVGYIFHNDQGSIVFRSFEAYPFGEPNPNTVETFNCQSQYGELICEIFYPNSVGQVSYTAEGYLVFTSLPIPEPAVQETVPEITEETVVVDPSVPETQAQDMPDDATEPVYAEGEPEDPSAAPTVPETVVQEASGVETFPAESTQPAEGEPASTQAATVPEVTQTLPPETLPPETVPAETVAEEPMLINGKPVEAYQINRTEYYDPEAEEHMQVRYVYVPMEAYTVVLYVSPGALRNDASFTVLRILRDFRSNLLPTLGISLLALAVLIVYLCCSAGRKPKSDAVHAGGLNCLPLDVYFFGDIFLLMLIAALGIGGTEYIMRQTAQIGLGYALCAAYAASLLTVGFGFAFVAQIKTPDGYWWKNTLTVRALKLVMRFSKWLEGFLGTKCFPTLGRLIIACWRFSLKTVVRVYRFTELVLTRAGRWIGSTLHRFFSLLPLTWQWLLTGCVLVFIAALTLNSHNGMIVMFGLILIFAVILYGAHCFGTLGESTRRMSKGDLDTKVDDRLLIGCFREFSGDLNNLAGVAVVAAQKQLKSERMKTELITNVSHDIKTPLTSIINYVDLLQKAQTEQEREEYLEVLSRQSQRLKKLIEDLMDMSKASTGNMAVEVTTLDAVESINQALGEFGDKLDRAQLTPVFRHTQESVPMLADGRLVWRVLSNLLSNAVKYAMPGTRLYIDLMELEGKVVISLKNISRDELNVDAEELMERFVRGDGSRNTEGSGLGLNIAKSLMELQKGQLQLLVDGDLFKVTLLFPGK